MKLLDCTLRDGGNVVGKGFSAALTRSMLEGLIKNNITFIEYGNAYGLGAYENAHSIAPLTDLEYMDLAQPYLDKAEIGMFQGAKNVSEARVALAAEKGLHFLRIGENAGDAEVSDTYSSIKLVKKYGLKAYYSIMKGYLLPPKELVDEAKRLEDCGLDGIIIMDSAGTMLPDQVMEYIQEFKSRLSIQVGFHGHNNRGLSVANAIAAAKAGADCLDCGLMGMARSAGNLATELAVAVLHQFGEGKDIDFYGLLRYIQNELAPAMEPYGYKPAITPVDLVLGTAGCHSNFLPMFREAAETAGVDLFQLIEAVSAINQKNPSKELVTETAEKLGK